MRPLFGITEAAVLSYTGIQACWGRMTQSVFCLSLFSLLFSLSLSAERGFEAQPADLLHLTPFMFVRMTRKALACHRVYGVDHGIGVIFENENRDKSFSRVYRTLFKRKNPVSYKNANKNFM